MKQFETRKVVVEFGKFIGQMDKQEKLHLAKAGWSFIPCHPTTQRNKGCRNMQCNSCVEALARITKDKYKEWCKSGES